MTERDIRGHMLVLRAAVEEARKPTEDEKRLLDAGFALAEHVLISLHRVTEALELIARMKREEIDP